MSILASEVIQNIGTRVIGIYENSDVFESWLKSTHPNSEIRVTSNEPYTRIFTVKVKDKGYCKVYTSRRLPRNTYHLVWVLDNLGEKRFIRVVKTLEDALTAIKFDLFDKGYFSADLSRLQPIRDGSSYGLSYRGISYVVDLEEII